MCGIVALLGTNVEPTVLQAMTTAIAHRGPDGSGAWLSADRRIGLGHRRLAIIDVHGSAQPMQSRDGRYVLVFNGEILNHGELRGQLGGSFATRGDTEVLLRGLIERGPAFLTTVRGQFAFALVDTRESEILVGRDPLGILPLYYAATPDGVAIASEPKALLPALPAVPDVDRRSLDDYLARRSVPAPDTLVEGVKKVLPGHVMRFDRDGRSRTIRYWTPPTHDETLDVSPDAAVAMLRSRLESAVDRALVADVPVGAYLSGGLDSSLIVALMRARSAEVKTFSAGFGDPRVDELSYARIAAEALGTHHHEVVVSPDDFMQAWTELTRIRDAPLSEPADIAVYRLAAVARTMVTVVLSGEGSDELFAGYPKYAAAPLIEALSVLPPPVRSRLATLVDRALPDHRGQALSRAIRAEGSRQRDLSWFAPFDQSARARLVPPSHRPSRSLRRGTRSSIDRMLDADLVTWLPDNLLERGDRMSMAASLELRPPFLDADVVDLALRLPPRIKRHRGESKWPVRQIGRELLPAVITSRPKSGFRVPLDSWFRAGLRDFAHDALLSDASLTLQVFPRAEVARILEAHDSGRSREEMRIWTLLSLEMWHRSVIAHSSIRRDYMDPAFTTAPVDCQTLPVHSLPLPER